MTSMRRRYVASTSFRRHVPTRFLTNQCQIITFLILKSDIIENSRIELRGIVLPLPSNQIKVIFIIILPFYLIHLWFFLFHIEIEGKGGWIIRGAKGYVGPPSQIIGGGGLAPPAPPHPLFLRLCDGSKGDCTGRAADKVSVTRESYCYKWWLKSFRESVVFPYLFWFLQLKLG